MIRRGIERLVRACGDDWEVVATFGDGKAALDYLHGIQGAVDLIITDVKMPEMDGLQFIQEAKKYYTFFPLLVSGYDDFQYLRAAILEGALDYMLKPLNREQFHTRLAEIGNRIMAERMQRHKWSEIERQAGKLNHSRQTQVFSSITSSGIDVSRLGYWVDEFPEGLYLLANISMDELPVKARSFQDKDWKAYTYALENIIAELVSQRLPNSIAQGWFWRGGDMNFWVMLHSGLENKQTFQDDGYQLCKLIRSSIQQYTPFTFSIAVADVIEDLYMLPNASRQVLSLLYNRLVFGGNQVFRTESVASGEGTGRQIDADSFRLSRKLRQAVEQADKDEAESIVKQIFNAIEGLESPQAIQRAIQYAIIQIYSVGMEHPQTAHRLNSLEDTLRKTKNAANLSQIKDNVRILLELVVHNIHRARQTHNVKPVEQARSWIRGNLENDISIKKIADQVHMNPTYFCQYFKMQTGETILDFVTKMRMEKAKELLQQPNLKLQEICRRIGYQDAKYFSRLFKQRYGKTPSKYRETL